MRELTTSALSGVSINKPTVFRLIKKNAKPALQGRYYPSIKRLPSEETIYDPERKTTRTIRYAPSEQSIYKDEQPDKVVVGDVVFQNGSLVVPYTNPLLLQFLEKSNHNISNPARIKGSKSVFKHVDPESDAKNQMDNEISQIKAANAVLQMEFSDLKAYARVLGVNINNGADMIRHDMLVLAKKDPSNFMAGIDDPLVKRQQVILDAMSYKIIKVSGRSVAWIMGDKESLIVPVPIGQDAVKWFSEWTMNEKDGEDVYKELQKKIKEHPAYPLPRSFNYIQQYAYENEVLPMFNEIDNIHRELLGASPVNIFALKASTE